MPTVSSIKTLVREIATLSNGLPLSVQQGTKDDKIWLVMNTDQCETEYETFNKRFDAMFGEDCRDSAGRLQYVRKGKLGMGLICAYLSKRNWADGFPLDLVEIKLQRLAAELKYLKYVTNFIYLSLPDLFQQFRNRSDCSNTTITPYHPNRKIDRYQQRSTTSALIPTQCGTGLSCTLR